MISGVVSMNYDFSGQSRTIIFSITPLYYTWKQFKEVIFSNFRIMIIFLFFTWSFLGKELTSPLPWSLAMHDAPFLQDMFVFTVPIHVKRCATESLRTVHSNYTICSNPVSLCAACKFKLFKLFIWGHNVFVLIEKYVSQWSLTEMWEDKFSTLLVATHGLQNVFVLSLKTPK